MRTPSKNENLPTDMDTDFIVCMIVRRENMGGTSIRLILEMKEA
jgi:hypothetical protein